MGAAPRIGPPRRVGRRLAWVVGLPTAATVAATLALTAASHRSELLLGQALDWSQHLVALHELGDAAHDFVDDAESHLGHGARSSSAAVEESARRVLEAARHSYTLASAFEPGEQEDEAALGRAVERLVQLGTAAVRDGARERLPEVVRCFLDEVEPRVESRIRDEEKGARAALRRARGSSAGLLGGAVTLALSLVGAAAWLSWRLSRHLVRAVGQLAAGARRISEGELEHRVSLEAEDELGALADAFNRMARALRENTVTRDELAREVTQRTAELERSGAELQGHLEKLRAAQEQLVATERMAAVGVLAAGVAHDVNSPLAVILSNLGFAHDVVARRGRTAEDEAEAEAALREAREAAERVRDTIRALDGFGLVDSPCGTPAAGALARTGS